MSRLISIFLIFVLCGCFKTPDRVERSTGMEIPEKWKNASEDEEGISGWLASFGDDHLESLVEEALERNYDLKAAEARLRKAAASSAVAGADLWPQLSAGASASRVKRNFIGFGALGGGGTVVSSTSKSYSPTLDMGWELDLWGEVRDKKKAAIEDALGAEALYRYAEFSLAANVTIGWLAVLEASMQKKLAEDTAESFERHRDIIDGRYKGGTVSALDLRLARNNTASARAVAVSRAQQLDATMRSLEIVLGRYPSAELSAKGGLPEVSEKIPAGLPLQLLERRPDVRASYHGVEAARRRVKSANKARLPNFTISASVGTAAERLGDMLKEDFSVWSLAGSVAQPLLQGGRLKGAAKVAYGDWEESLSNYRTIILEAFKDAETAMAAEKYLSDRISALDEAAEEAGAAEKLAWDRYVQGTADIVTVLDAQRRAFDARSTLIEAEAAYLTNRVDLYLALGGDFRTVEDTNKEN